MKDLLVYVADADALAFIKAILDKPEALGIQPLAYDIERHPARDSGMVQSGAELVRMKKGKYAKALLVWDHHGSGREHKQIPDAVRSDIQHKLDSFTWQGNSAVIVLMPELEQWLWFCESALISHCGITQNDLAQWLEERAAKLGRPLDVLKAECPKELFEHVMKDRLKRTISPRDFGAIGKRASVKTLLKCPSFQSVADTLQDWFGSAGKSCR